MATMDVMALICPTGTHVDIVCLRATADKIHTVQLHTTSNRTMVVRQATALLPMATPPTLGERRLLTELSHIVEICHIAAINLAKFCALQINFK